VPRLIVSPLRMTAEDLIVWRNIAIVPCIVGVLWSLAVVLCREWVKSDLRNRICQPISVRWRFFASTRIACAFKVIYSDVRGQIHRATCCTYWHRRGVTWESDEIIDYRHETV